MATRVDSPQASRWPHWLAVCAALAAVPLVLFGGSVTTIGAGMAVDGWLVAEGHFLVLFPVEKWFRDVGTFVEHSHRLFGVLVGLFALGAALSSWFTRASGAARATSLLALLAVCAQGAIGGFRVLESSPQLAFLHGAAAHAVFALLCVSAALLARRPREQTAESGASGSEKASSLRFAALGALLLVYGQVVLGAWYRHGLRPVPDEHLTTRLAAHFVGAALVFLAVLALSGVLLREDGGGGGHLARCGRRLRVLLGLQILLGFASWIGYRPDAVGPLEWTLSILHVLVGALLLAQCAIVVLRVRFELLPVRGRSSQRPELSALEGAR